MQRLSLKMKLALGFGGLWLIMVAMGIVDYNSVSKLANTSQQVDDMMSRKEISAQIEGTIEKQSAAVRGFLLTGDGALLKRAAEGKQEFADTMGTLAKLSTNDQDKKLQAEIQQHYDEFRVKFDSEVQLRRAGKTKEAVALMFSPQLAETRAQLFRAGAERRDAEGPERSSRNRHAGNVLHRRVGFR